MGFSFAGTQILAMVFFQVVKRKRFIFQHVLARLNNDARRGADPNHRRHYREDPWQQDPAS